MSKYLSGATRMPADVLDAVVLALGASPAQAREWATAWEQAVTIEHRPLRAAGATTPRQLPAAVSAFTGRRECLKQLDQLLDDGGGRAVVVSAVSGTAGVGKTALAVRWAHHVADRFPDGQLYVNLRGYDPDEPMPTATALAHVLRALGAGHIPPEPEERAALYRSLLFGKRVLVVLDNARSADQVRPLIPGAVGCLAVVTSRSRLMGLVVRDGAVRLDLERLSDAESRDMLAELLDRRPALEEAQACAELIRACAGLPLALRVAAERIAGRPEAGMTRLVTELAEVASALDVLGVGDDELSDVRTVFSWSYRVLEAAPARLFRLLGLIPGPDFDLFAAANLADLPVPSARRHLQSLVTAYLLEQDAAGRYSFHDLLRAYAAETCLATDAEADRHAAVTRYLDWSLHTAGTAVDLINPNRHRPAIPSPSPTAAGPRLADADAARLWLEAERTGLLAATRHAAVSGHPDHAWRLCQALWSFYFRAGYTDDWAESHRCGLAAAETAGDAFGQAEIWHALGVAEAVAGRYDQALRFTREALRFREIVGDPGQQAATLGNLASVHHDLGQLREAVSIHRRALATMRQAGNSWGEAMCLVNLGVAAAALGRHREAVDRLSEALDLHRATANRAEVARTLSSIGFNLSHLEAHDRALTAAAEAVAITEEIGARKFLASALNNLSVVRMNRGEFEEAERLGRRAQQIALDVGDRGEQTEAAMYLGVNALFAGDPASALDLLEQARTLLDGQQQTRWDLEIAQRMGDACQALGNPVAARDHYVWVLGSEADSGTAARCRAAYGLARVALAESPPDLPTARRWLKEAEEVLSQIELPALARAVGTAVVNVHAMGG